MKTNYLLVLFALLLAIPQAADAKKKKDIAIQLYSVRDIINNGTDLNVVLKNLAQMGYTSIEAANYDNGKFYGKTPEEFKNAVEKAGMEVLSSHCSRGLSDKEVASGDGWIEERTGLHPNEFIETRRHRFSSPVLHHTNDSVNVLNLLEGEEAVVESPTHAFEPFVVHYAETFIIPASVGEYTIKPYGKCRDKECVTIKAYVRF